MQAQSLPLLYVQDRAGVDVGYLKEEIEFVRFVGYRSAADVVLTLTSRSTGPGGVEYLFAFRGRGRFAGLDLDLTWVAGPTISTAQRNEGLIGVLLRGLVPYVAQTDAGDFVTVNYEPEGRELNGLRDAWNYWVFEASAEGSADGEEYHYEYGFEAAFEARRVTERDRLELEPNIGLADERDFDEEGEVEYRRVVRTYALEGMYGRMLNRHVAVGVRASAANDEHSNLLVSARAGPVVELSLFQYREHRHRDVRLTCSLAGIRNDYYDTTVFGVTSEFLVRSEIASRVNFTQEWGEVGLSATWGNYLHDFGLNRVTIGTDVSVELGAGFEFGFKGKYAFIHDQVAVREDPEEEYEKPTDFSYSASVGLTYTFGSVYSDVVNPAFD